MTQKVTFVVDAQQRAAIDAFLQIGQAVDAVAAKGNRAGGSMAKGANEAGAAWDKGLKILAGYPLAFGKMLTGTMGVLAALNQVRAEFERIKALQDKAKTAMDQAQDPYYKLRQSVSPEFAKGSELPKMIRQGMQSYGSENPADYLNLAGTMESARGDMGEVKAMNAVNIAAALTGRMGMPAEDSTEFGGAMLDALNVQAAHGKNYTPKAIAGKFLSMYGVTRSTSIGQFARYDMRTINALARHGFSMDEAIGFQSAIAGSKPDPMGRISATGMGLLTGDIAKAYAVGEGQGFGIKGVTSQEFEKSGMNMFDVARSDTKTGRFIQAYLYGIRAMNPKAAKLAVGLKGMGPDFTGHARGESGMFELSRELLDPNSGLFGRAREASSRVASDAQAEAHYDEVMNTAPTDRHEKYFASRAAQRGAIGVGKWEQVMQATRGGVVGTQAELADLMGSSDLGQKIAGAVTSLRASRRDPEEVREQELGIYEGAITSLRTRARVRAAKVKYGGQGLPEAGAAPVTEAELQSKTYEDERHLIDTLQQLIETLKSQKVEVTVQDPTGREVGRSTSRPRDVEKQSGGATSSW